MEEGAQYLKEMSKDVEKEFEDVWLKDDDSTSIGVDEIKIGR